MDHKEIANNENNVIIERDDGRVFEWRFKEIDGGFYAVMGELEFMNPHCASLIEVANNIKTRNLGRNEEKARNLWNSVFRHIKDEKGRG